jgi:hypothetical protein
MKNVWGLDVCDNSSFKIHVDFRCEETSVQFRDNARENSESPENLTKSFILQRSTGTKCCRCNQPIIRLEQNEKNWVPDDISKKWSGVENEFKGTFRRAPEEDLVAEEKEYSILGIIVCVKSDVPTLFNWTIGAIPGITSKYSRSMVISVASRVAL